MSSESSLPAKLITFITWLKTFRYVKFGLVGASGTVLNIAVLHLAPNLPV